MLSKRRSPSAARSCSPSTSASTGTPSGSSCAHSHRSDYLQAITYACPRDRSRDIQSLTEKRKQLSDDLAGVREELAQLDQQRGWRQRNERAARRVVLTNPANSLTNRVATIDDEVERTENAQDAYRAYVAEHGDDLARLPRVNHEIDSRIAEIVAADLAEPPQYLSALGPSPTDPARLRAWRHAADLVERYRADHNITDPNQPLGQQPVGEVATLWRNLTRSGGPAPSSHQSCAR